MTSNDFNVVLNNRIQKIREILESKATEYATSDRLYNFKRAGEINRKDPKEELWGMATKHLVSVIDIVEKRIPLTKYLVNEKIGDMINYLILLEALCIEELCLPPKDKSNTGKI